MKLNDRQTVPFILLDNGDYRCFVSKVTEKRGPQGPYVEIQYEEPQTGKVLFDNRSIASVWPIEQFVEVCGGTAEDAHEIDWAEPTQTRQFLGLPILVTVYSDEWPLGSKIFRNKVGRILPADETEESVEEPVDIVGVTR